MSEIENFFRQAGKIHDKHIRESENADIKIATKRIENYFKGELNLGWKSIIYEINKLPELERNKYFKQLVEEQKANTSETIYTTLKHMNFFKRVKFLLKGL